MVRLSRTGRRRPRSHRQDWRQPGDGIPPQQVQEFVRIKAKSYSSAPIARTSSREGMIGLYKAVRDFKADRSFRASARSPNCASRVRSSRRSKTANRQKHIPLNQYISLNKPIYDEDSERTLLDVMASQKTSDPEELVVTKEVSDDIRRSGFARISRSSNHKCSVVSRRQELPGDGARPRPAREVDRQRVAARKAEDRKKISPSSRFQ